MFKIKFTSSGIEKIKKELGESPAGMPYEMSWRGTFIDTGEALDIHKLTIHISRKGKQVKLETSDYEVIEN